MGVFFLCIVYSVVIIGLGRVCQVGIEIRSFVGYLDLRFLSCFSYFILALSFSTDCLRYLNLYSVGMVGKRDTLRDKGA